MVETTHLFISVESLVDDLEEVLVEESVCSGGVVTSVSVTLVKWIVCHAIITRYSN